MTLYEKYIAFWSRLPSEVRVSVWVILAYALSEVAMLLEAIQSEDRMVMAVINVVLYFLVNRRQIVTSRLTN